MLFVFRKMRTAIHHRVENNEPGLYLYLIFPIAITFILTFSIARLLSYFAPEVQFLFLPTANFRIHHYAYGIIFLAISGYLALVFSSPRNKYLISLLHGFGLGLAFDEFAMWLNLEESDPARWSYDGILIILGVFFLIISAKPGVKMLKIFWPFRRKQNLT